MTKPIDKNIKKHLADKQIFLIPYCHADHAWLHSRDWHERRYLAVFDKAMKLLEDNPSYKYFFDGWSELLRPILRKRANKIPFMRDMLKDGRLALLSGHWSNIRFSHIGDETSIRNIIYGHREVNEIFPEARLNGYANLDVGIGHSQVPQILNLAECKNYFAWRPQKGLDKQGIPRSFVWKGLSGNEVLVTRHSYQGWFHAEEFYDKKDKEIDFSCKKIEFDFLLKYAWEKYLKVPVEQGLKTVSFCQGGDDLAPNTDAYYGIERNIFSIMEEWNSHGLGKMEFGTPYNVFDNLKKEKLQKRSGPLDQCELCFHIARNGKHSIWNLREKADRALLLAEESSALASLEGFQYPQEKFESLWKEYLTFCTHAIEFLFSQDYDEADFILRKVIRNSSEITQKAIEAMLDGIEKNDPDSFCAFNPLPENREEILEVDLPNIDNARRTPSIKNVNGEELLSQIVYTGGLNRDFIILVEAELPPCGLSQFNISWSREDSALSERENVQDMNATLESDTIKLKFEDGQLVSAANKRTGGNIKSKNDAAIFEPLSLPQKIDYWMANSFADNPLPFVPETLTIVENGPLRWRITRTGRSGPHRFIQHFDLYKDNASVDLKTIADLSYDSANICIGMPLPETAKLSVDIPFGVEDRDLSDIEYGHKGEGNYENIERIIPGIFWGKSWVFAGNGKESFGFVTIDGPRYFRRYGNPERLLHFLVCLKPDQTEGWMTKINSQRACGRNIYKHKLVLDGENWQESGMPGISQRARTTVPVLFGALKSNKKLKISSDKVRISAFYKEGEEFILRVVNMNSGLEHVKISLPFAIKNIKKCNFKNNRMECDLQYGGNSFKTDISPWEIATFNIKKKKLKL